ncbi:hypothetical protein EVAR_98781_1 [Eumeta japonica]|uniref:Uncharacterized protein n=1 Tax=Eumeta variegata TaxID=151549 RepID=A0A4C1YXZ0_EUMVA|nr:hypothetical protein EVAR_98781_1 [Eumeta japonica]
MKSTRASSARRADFVKAIQHAVRVGCEALRSISNSKDTNPVTDVRTDNGARGQRVSLWHHLVHNPIQAIASRQSRRHALNTGRVRLGLAISHRARAIPPPTPPRHRTCGVKRISRVN